MIKILFGTFSLSLRPGGSSSVTLPPSSVCMDNMDTLVMLNDLDPISLDKGIREELPVPVMNAIPEEASMTDIREEGPMNDLCQETPMNDIHQEAFMNDIREEAPINNIRQKAPMNDIPEEAPKNDIPEEASMNDIREEALMNDIPNYMEDMPEQKPAMFNQEKHGAECPSEDPIDDERSISPVQDTLMGLIKHFFST